MYPRDQASLDPKTSRRALRTRRIMGSAKELTLEVLRLLVLYPHDEQAHRKIGVSKEETAARLCKVLPRPSGVLMTADDGRKLQCLLYMEPMLGPSVAIGVHAWNIGPLIIAPDAPGNTVSTMLDKSLAALEVPADFLIARVPSADANATKGLQEAGFVVVSGEAVAVAKLSEPAQIEPKSAGFAPLEPELLDSVLEIACDCMQCTSFACNHGLDRDHVCRFSRLDLESYIYEKDKNGVVALDSDGYAVGFATYSFNSDIKTPPVHGVGSMDQLCVSANGESMPLETSLGTRVLEELAVGGVETVITRTTMNDTSAKIESLKKIGFEVTHSNLVLRRGNLH